MARRTKVKPTGIRTWLRGLFTGRKRKAAEADTLPAITELESALEHQTGTRLYDRMYEGTIYTEMYEDSLIGPCIDTIVDYMVTAPQTGPVIDVRCSNESLEEAIKMLLERSGIVPQLPEIARDLVCFGDVFLSVDAKSLAVKRLIWPYQIVMNWQLNGQIKMGGRGSRPGEAAYERYYTSGGAPVEQWGPWEMCHIALPPVEYGYGTSILKRLHPYWKQYSAVEQRVVQQMTEPSSTRVHYVLVPMRATPEEVQDIIRTYQMQNTLIFKSVDSSTGNIVTKAARRVNDLFIPTRYTPDGKLIQGKIEVLEDAKTELVKREDMLWWINRVLSCLRVPPQLLYWDLEQPKFSRGSSSVWEEGWARYIKHFQTILVEGIYQVVLRLAAASGILHHVVASDLVLSLPAQTWKSELDSARAMLYRAQAAASMLKGGIPPTWAIRFAYSEPKEWDDWVDKLPLPEGDSNEREG